MAAGTLSAVTMTSVASGCASKVQVIVIPCASDSSSVSNSGPDLALELVESRATASGVTMQVYRTAGRPQYG